MTDEEFLRAFEATTLPYGQWTHRAHVKVGFLYLRGRSFSAALNVMRDAIQAYNAVNHEKVRRGYHETVTQAFLRLIAAAVGTDPAFPSADAFCDANPELLDQSILGRHYSPEVLRSERSRTEFVGADLRPLPSDDG